MNGDAARERRPWLLRGSLPVHSRGRVRIKQIKNISIIGAGAIGAAYASMFFEADRNSVCFLAAGQRAARLKRDGIIVNQKQYFIPVRRPDQAATVSSIDLIIVAVKHQHLQRAIRDLRSSVGDHTIILSLMNGIDSEEKIGSVYGKDKVLYGMVLGIDAVRADNKVTYSTPGRVFFGEAKNLSHTGRVKRLKDFFDRIGIAYVIPDDMIRALWWKFMINVGINQASAALRSTYGVFQTSQEAKDLMESAMREVAAIASKLDIYLSDEDILNWYTVLSSLSPAGKTSMLQDMEAGRKTEVEMFAGKVIQLGKRLHIPTPVNKKLFELIRSAETEASKKDKSSRKGKV